MFIPSSLQERLHLFLHPTYVQNYSVHRQENYNQFSIQDHLGCLELTTSLFTSAFFMPSGSVCIPLARGQWCVREVISHPPSPWRRLVADVIRLQDCNAWNMLTPKTMPPRHKRQDVMCGHCNQVPHFAPSMTQLREYMTRRTMIPSNLVSTNPLSSLKPE